MALRALPPKPGATVQVIGAGLPRTATNSFCAALEYLLDGPPYHVGVQSVLSGDVDDVLAFIQITNLRPYRSAADKQKALNLLSNRLKGYVATADPPLSQLVPELMELYPNAKVVCTTREREPWAESMALTIKMVKPRLQRFITFWLGGQFDYLPLFWTKLTKTFEETYGTSVQDRADADAVYDRHHAWISEIVPKEKLLYFNVKDGWEPLCNFLDCPVPDMPFPRLNDSKSYEAVFKGIAMRGLLRWAVFLVVVFASIGLLITAWHKYM